jgi:hypothetical protein
MIKKEFFCIVAISNGNNRFFHWKQEGAEHQVEEKQMQTLLKGC